MRRPGERGAAQGSRGEEWDGDICEYVNVMVWMSLMYASEFDYKDR